MFLFFFFSENPSYRQISLLIYILAASTDWYDGYVARRWGYITRWGKFLDPFADKVLTSAAFIAFVFVGYAEAWMVWVIVVRDFYITVLRSYCEYRHKNFETKSLAKTKTFLQMVIIYIFMLIYIIRTTDWILTPYGKYVDSLATPSVIDVLMIIITVLTAYTGISYTFANRQIIKELFEKTSHGTSSERTE